MVDGGMTPMQAIEATTRSAAELMGLQDELGTLEPGKRADLVLVDGDPLANLALLRDKTKLLAVMKDGAFVKKPEMVAQRSRWSRTAA
jgi:imidazolonepropionase-like amidohydrolase